MFKVILKCWRCAGKDTRRCCGVSLLCQWIFTDVGYVPAQTHLQAEPQGQHRI